MTHPTDGIPRTGVYTNVDLPDWRIIKIDGESFGLRGMRRTVLWRRFEPALSHITDYPAPLNEQRLRYRITDESVEVMTVDQIEESDEFRLTMSDGSTRSIPAPLLRTLLSD